MAQPATPAAGPTIHFCGFGPRERGSLTPKRPRRSFRCGRARTLGPADRECIRHALEMAPDGEVVPADVRSEVVVFVQPAESPDEAGRARKLGHQAAMLGWPFRERHDPERALEAFPDAAWAYRLPEFQVLIGMQHEELGRPKHALEAYRTYLAERPETPDVSDIRRPIARLQQRVVEHREP